LRDWAGSESWLEVQKSRLQSNDFELVVAESTGMVVIDSATAADEGGSSMVST
jgi:hypothetical protein